VAISNNDLLWFYKNLNMWHARNIKNAIHELKGLCETDRDKTYKLIEVYCIDNHLYLDIITVSLDSATSVTLRTAADTVASAWAATTLRD
jgi:hypothetical protein